MFPHSVWQGLDRLSFGENAILLETKARSQGKSTRAAFRQDDHDFLPGGDLTRQMLRDFIDDFALVVAGNGGKDNVSAACIEIQAQDQIFVLRVAKNEGLNERTQNGLNVIAQLMTKRISTESELLQRQNEILVQILDLCTGRLLKHIQRFTNELRHARCRPAGQYATPIYLLDIDQTETLQDIQRLGKRCRENHNLYMQTCEDRLNQLRNLFSELARPSGGSNLLKMMLLTERAYEIRRSSSFRQFLQSNLDQTQRARVITSLVGGILERLGKISRFYRAAKTFTTVGVKLFKRNMTIQIQGVPAPKFSITELKNRTPAQLRLRGGHKYASCSEHQLQGMINRWPRYRLHSEIQLLIFYQEYPHLLPQDRYIGSDKLSCYLCHSFITNHGQFEVKGCHQSLYSLWTVPDIVAFENEERAEVFRNALRALCEDLEQKVTALRDLQSIRGKHKPNNESVANLSRLSLPLALSKIDQGSISQATCEDNFSDDQNRRMEGEIPAIPHRSLTIIPEVPMLEILQHNAESDEAEQLETSQPVTELHGKMAPLELDAAGSDLVRENMLSNCHGTRDDKRHKEMRPAAWSSKCRQRRLRPTKIQIRRPAQNRRIQGKFSGRRAPKHEQSGVSSRNEPRHRTRRKIRGHAEWRDKQHRWHEKGQSRRQDRPKLGSAKINRSNRGILSRFWLICIILMRGCFGDSRKSN